MHPLPPAAAGAQLGHRRRARHRDLLWHKPLLEQRPRRRCVAQCHFGPGPGGRFQRRQGRHEIFLRRGQNVVPFPDPVAQGRRPLRDGRRHLRQGPAPGGGAVPALPARQHQARDRDVVPADDVRGRRQVVGRHRRHHPLHRPGLQRRARGPRREKQGLPERGLESADAQRAAGVAGQGAGRARVRVVFRRRRRHVQHEQPGERQRGQRRVREGPS